MVPDSGFIHPVPVETLEGRCAVVTGAGRGFGEQIAVDLAELGAAVAVLDVDVAAAERCATRLARAGARSLVQLRESGVG